MAFSAGNGETIFQIQPISWEEIGGSHMMGSRIAAFLLGSVVTVVFAGAIANAQVTSASIDSAETKKDIGFTEE